MLIEDRLDLHGLSQEQAHKKLSAFIGRVVQQNFRHVLIITGKGRDGHGILRHKVPEWLKDAPLCNHVNAISYAQPKDGGEGAIHPSPENVSARMLKMTPFGIKSRLLRVARKACDFARTGKCFGCISCSEISAL